MTPRGLWPAFIGAVFLLLGLSLIGDARFNAQTAADWQKEAGSGGAPPAALVWGYRAFGAAFAALGGALIAGWACSPARLVAWLGPSVQGPRELRRAGAALAAAGVVLGAFRASSRARGARHAFVDEELGRPALSPGRRLSLWCGRLIAAAFAGYGIFIMLSKETP